MIPKRLIFFVASLVIVAFGQNAWISFFGSFAAAFGYALFWFGVIRCALPWQRFAWGSTWFACIQAIQLSWMSSIEYMGPMFLLVYALLAIALGLQFGILSWFVGSDQPLTVLRGLGFAGLWVIFEWVRLGLFTGFTWNPTGIALTTSILSLQMASLFGIYGLSFWVIFVNWMAYRWLQLRTRTSLLIWVSCAVFPYLFGAIQLLIVPRDLNSISTLLVQTALLPEERDYDPKAPERHIDPLEQWDRILTLIEDAHAPQVDLIVLSESALPNDAYQSVYPFFAVEQIWKDHFKNQTDLPILEQSQNRPSSELIQMDQTHASWVVSNAFLVQALSNHYHCEVIVGLNDRDLNRQYNAAFHFSPFRNFTFRTEKRVLVPLGEYIPLKNSPWFTSWIAKQFGIFDSFEPGKDAKVFFGQVPFGVSICYEETYSDLIRLLRAMGARMFVNISNDVWFPHSRLARQHFDHGMVRAVENGLPLIRSCNTGITGGVDCFGRILNLYPESQAGALLLRVPLTHFSTLYSCVGDRAILIISAIFGVFLLFPKSLKK